MKRIDLNALVPGRAGARRRACPVPTERAAACRLAAALQKRGVVNALQSATQFLAAAFVVPPSGGSDRASNRLKPELRTRRGARQRGPGKKVRCAPAPPSSPSCSKENQLDRLAIFHLRVLVGLYPIAIRSIKTLNDGYTDASFQRRCTARATPFEHGSRRTSSPEMTDGKARLMKHSRRELSACFLSACRLSGHSLALAATWRVTGGLLQSILATG